MEILFLFVGVNVNRREIANNGLTKKYTMKHLERKVINAKDVQLITGKSEKTSRNLLRKIKKELNKEKNHFVTFEEFYAYTGICMLINFLVISYLSLTLNGMHFTGYEFGFNGQGFSKLAMLKR